MYHLLLLGLGLLTCLIGYLSVAQIIGKRHSLIWGLLVIPFPPVVAAFAVGDWKFIKRPLIVVGVGLLIVSVTLAAGGFREIKSQLTQYGFEETIERSTNLVNGIFGAPSAPAESTEASKTPESTQAGVIGLALPVQTDDGTALPLRGIRLASLDKIAYQPREIDSAENYVGYKVRVHLNNGLIREAILVKKEHSRLTLKHQTHSGYIAYEIPMSIIIDFYVRLPTTEART